MILGAMPLDEHLFWISGAVGSVILLLIPAFKVANRLGSLDARIQQLQTDVNWLKHMIGINGKDNAPPSHS